MLKINSWPARPVTVLVVGRGGAGGAAATLATLESLVIAKGSGDLDWDVLLLSPRDPDTEDLMRRLDGDIAVTWGPADTAAAAAELRRRGRDVEVVVAGDAVPVEQETSRALGPVDVALVDEQFLGSDSASSTQPGFDGLSRIRWNRDVDPDLSHPLIVFTNTSLGRVYEFRARRRVAWLLESPDVHSEMTEVVLSNPRAFDLVLTNDRELARRLPRAVHLPAAGCWIPPHRQEISEKSAWCSMIASRKASTVGHRFRLEVAEAVRAAGLGVDVYGRGHDGVPGFGEVAEKSDALSSYRYSITMENCRAPGYFSEKLIDCFRTGTVPIYWGAPEVGEFFDPSGILAFASLAELPAVLERATPHHWERVRPSIERNFKIAAGYRAVEDRVYEAIRPLLGAAG